MCRTLITFFGKYDGDSAGSKRVRHFARGLRDAGDEVFVVSYSHSNRDTIQNERWQEDRLGIPFVSVPVANGANTRSQRIRQKLTLPARLAALSVSVCHTRKCNRAVLYGTYWLGMQPVVRELRRASVPTVTDFNEWFRCRWNLLGIWANQALFRRLCVPKLSGIIGISPFWEKFAARVAKPVILIPAMEDDEFADLPPNGQKSFNLVYVGVLYRRDLPDTMLDGVRLALAKGCDFRFIIVGMPGLFPESVRAARRIKTDPIFRGRVEVTGWISREQLRQIYEQAGAFLLLRNDEWESRASNATRLPEFLATGRPVITSGTPDIAAWLRHMETAWLLPANNAPEELANAICNLSIHRDQGHTLGLAGKEFAVTNLSYRRHGMRLKQFLDDLEMPSAGNA